MNLLACEASHLYSYSQSTDVIDFVLSVMTHAVMGRSVPVCTSTGTR